MQILIAVLALESLSTFSACTNSNGMRTFRNMTIVIYVHLCKIVTTSVNINNKEQ